MITNVYVDAFNLYYGCLKGTPCRWLNLADLCKNELPSNQINRIRVFTARVKARPNNPQQPARQQAYHRALQTIPNLSLHFGHYLESQVWMRLAQPPAAGSSFVRVTKTEEKGSDVNLATYLLSDVFDSDCQAALVISNDSDLAEPIRIVRQKFKIPVLVMLPCRPGGRQSVQLKKVASKAWAIPTTSLAASQFPATIQDANGVITKPATW